MAITLYAISLAKRSVYNVEENFLYIPTFLMGRLLWRVHFTNEAPTELQSGGVLVANHRSSVDPFFVQLSAGRRVHWMVAKEYCNHFAFGPLLKLCQVIPTNRSGMDTASTKAAIRMTREGRLVGMFPEGRLNKTDDALLSFRSGAAVVAEKAGVPIIPLWIEGSPYRQTVWSPVTMPAHVRITFGAPIPTKTEELQGHGDSRADELMLEWGQQLVRISGKANQQIQLSARRKRKRS
ncbi:MAG: lysophospholipid acyltransferase family protein [Planctomycetota bacterium]